jgi:hypothetical protein
MMALHPPSQKQFEGNKNPDVHILIFSHENESKILI